MRAPATCQAAAIDPATSLISPMVCSILVTAATETPVTRELC
jgi:hypothetical protein